MTVGIVYDPIYLDHQTGSDPENPSRLVTIMNFLEEKGVLDDPSFQIIKPRKASLDQIRYVHDDKLIREIQKICELSEKTQHIQYLDADTAASPKTFEASLYSVGGNLQAADEILDGNIRNAFALVRPPGHHSNTHRFAGFCIFNNIAVTAEYLFREKGIKRIALIDWDCHHGNGTQDIFYYGSESESGELVLFNSHQYGYFYPGSGNYDEIGIGKGAGKIINYPMPAGSSDDVIPRFFNEIISPICDEFKPEFILISAGFDTHWTDGLTDMNWTYHAPAKYLAMIKTIAHKYANDRILITLEGGYAVDKQARAVYNCLKVLNNEDDKLLMEEMRSSRTELLEYFSERLIPALKDKLKPFWNCF
ncbi:MAG: histone deacetylase [Candidatus Lokiarchaeota archaeon]|nr:histone deacetylase [Candidatus Lokiarchaeota archaeon]